MTLHAGMLVPIGLSTVLFLATLPFLKLKDALYCYFSSIATAIIAMLLYQALV